MEAMRSKRICRWALDEFDVTERGKLDAEVLERVRRLVHNEHVCEKWLDGIMIPRL